MERKKRERNTERESKKREEEREREVWFGKLSYQKKRL
jgi:hypothetical protein